MNDQCNCYLSVIAQLTRCDNCYYVQDHKSKNERPMHRQDLPIVESIYGVMSKQELLEAQEQEQQLAYQDKLVERTKERKNALESYVYDIRNKVSIWLRFCNSFPNLKVLFSDESLSSFLRGIGALQLILKGKKYQLIYSRQKIGFMKKVMMRLKQFTLVNSRS